jgi:hypothetical protein
MFFRKHGHHVRVQILDNETSPALLSYFAREHLLPARTSCTKTHQHRRAGHPNLPTSLSKSPGNYTPVLPHQPLARAPGSS